MRRTSSLLSLTVLLWLAAGAAVPGARAQEAAQEAAQAAAVPLLEPLAHGRALELPELDPEVPSPAGFLGYPLGARFTHHHRILAYLEHLAEASPRVALWTYGASYEGRPLTLLAISTPENVERLDAIRTARRKLADPRGLAPEEIEALVAGEPAIVWLAYGVHGNESSSAEAAMAAAYALAAARGPWEELLEGTVVLIDPLVNPDGRERYVAFYEQTRGRVPDPDPAAAEHREPWPGGRQNHYLIDLNRDWSWASQRETRHRLEAYREWEPQVYVDYHEMFSGSTYFFPPPADPVHPLLDRDTVAWLDVFGRANAEAFDRQGWPYFKAEVFDLDYPGYGDSYPGFRGAVGMTYEMAGHGRAGLVVEQEGGRLLTLADRIARHFTTSMATVRTAAESRRELLETFVRSRAEAARQEGPAYLWPANAPEAGTLAELLSFHGVEVARLDGEIRLRVRALDEGNGAGRPAERSFPAGTYAVHVGQPLGNLARALLDRSPAMEEEFLERQRERLERNVRPEFYDITSWSLPLAFNLEAWVAPEPGSALEGRTSPVEAGGGGLAESGVRGPGRVGFLVRPAGLAGYRFAGALLREGLEFRVALDELELGGAAYPAGTVFVPRVGNEGADARGDEGGEGPGGSRAGEGGEAAVPLEERLARLAAEAGVVAQGAETFYSTAGISLGSDLAPAVRAPEIGVLSGPGISPTSFGFLWHLLDRQVAVPHARLAVERLDAVDLSDLDVLVLPDGQYGRALSEEAAEAVERWVRDGGVLVAVGDAHGWLAERELTRVEAGKPPEEGEPGDGAGAGEPGAGSESAAEAGSEAEAAEALARRPIHTPGAVLETRLTPGHALGAGLPDAPPGLFSGTRVLQPTGDPQVDVLRAAPEDPVVTGVAWPEAEERLAGSLLVSLERVGEGAVVLFSQDPEFRLFWRGTAPLFLNAALYGPTVLAGDGY